MFNPVPNGCSLLTALVLCTFSENAISQTRYGDGIAIDTGTGRELQIDIDSSYREAMGADTSHLSMTEATQWGAGSAHAAMSIRLVSRSLTIGQEKAAAVILIANTSTEPIRIPFNSGLDFKVTGLDEDKNILMPTSKGAAYDNPQLGFSQRSAPLFPGAVRAFSLNLAEYLKFDRPGRFLVYCHRRVLEADGREVELTSNAVIFDVVADPSTHRNGSPATTETERKSAVTESIEASEERTVLMSPDQDRKPASSQTNASDTTRKTDPESWSSPSASSTAGRRTGLDSSSPVEEVPAKHGFSIGRESAVTICFLLMSMAGVVWLMKRR